MDSSNYLDNLDSSNNVNKEFPLLEKNDIDINQYILIEQPTIYHQSFVSNNLYLKWFLDIIPNYRIH